MKFRHPAFALLLALVFVLGLAVPAAVAYVTVKSPSLVNVFTADVPPEGAVTVPVRVHKTILASGTQTIGPEGFTFRLTEAESGASQTFQTNTIGYGALTLAYTPEDAGKTYTYLLTEVNDSREHVTYSDLVYRLTISPALDAGVLTAALTLNDEPVQAVLAEFENIYAPTTDVPATGDDAPLMVWMLGLLLCGAGLILLRARAKR